MSEKEYVVTLNKGVDYAQFNQEMIASTGAGDIPNRTVDVANARHLSTRNTHYALTEDEAVALRNDARVTDVQLRPEDRDDIEIGYEAIQTANFNKSSTDSGDYRDWGKIRHSFVENIYGTSTSLGGNYDRPYSMDGTGIDIVIQDSGLQVDHPEFKDANGISRVQLIDWYAESGLTGSQDANHYRDHDGHGTHCGGTATGLNFGWAPNARVYSVKVGGLEGSGDSDTGISISQCFDVIKGWHQNKPVDPKTGFKRPTIVNASWGYSSPVSSGFSGTISSVFYRGTTYSDSNDTSFSATPNSHMRNTYGIYPYYANGAYRIPIRIASVDADVQDCIDAGVHICIAAGNNSFKADIATGDDYNNIVFYGGFYNRNYHRGSSPFDETANMVGCTDSTPLNATTERKTGFSTTGPGVSIFAAGENIISACSTTNRFGAPSYFGDSNFKQTNISGTSMASPQVCGVGALYLQADPSLTPAQLKSKLEKDALAVLKDESNPTNYSDTTDICGGYNRMLFNRYNKALPFSSNIYGLQKKNR